MGYAALIPEESRRSLDQYEDATKNLGVATDLLYISLSDDLAPALTDITNLATTLIQKFIENKKEFKSFSDTAFEFQKKILPGLESFLSFLDRAKQKTEDLTKEQKFYTNEAELLAQYAALGYDLQVDGITKVERQIPKLMLKS